MAKRTARSKKRSARIRSTALNRVSSKIDLARKLKPISKSTVTAAKARNILADVHASSSAKMGKSLNMVGFKNSMANGLLTVAARESNKMAIDVGIGILSRKAAPAESWHDARAIIHWGRGRNHDERRRAVVKIFQSKSAEVLLINTIGELPKADARRYMKDYFRFGGSNKCVAEWLQLAGKKIRDNGSRKTGTDGWGWVKDVVGGVVGGIVDAIDTVVDAVIDAGRSIADFVGDIAGWTLGKIADFLTAVIEAGKTLAEVISEIAGIVINTQKKILKALKMLGHSVADIIDAAAGLLPGPLKLFVRSLLKIGTRVIDILIGFADRVLSATRTALEALLAEGIRLATVVRDIVRHVGESFRESFFRGLIALGKTPLTIIKEAAKSGAAIALGAFAVLLEIWGGYRGLTKAEMREAQRIFGWSIDLHRVKITTDSIPADVANWLNGNRPFTTMYVINFASGAMIDKRTLIHELTHVWQGVTAGPVYMVEALHSQIGGRGYNVTEADIKAADGDINNLEREQQAVVVERYWAYQYNRETGKADLYRQLARQVYSGRRGIFATSQPLLRSLARA